MAAPVVTVRAAPTGTHLYDGYPSKIAFSLWPVLEVWEKSVTPFGIDGREPVDQTTMWNQIYTTVSPRLLRTITPATAVCAYDPIAWERCNNMLNLVQSVTHLWSDGSTLTLWAFLQKVEMAELKEGEQPEMTLTIMVANIDPSAVSGLPTEAPPIFSFLAGTGGFALTTGQIPPVPIYQS